MTNDELLEKIDEEINCAEFEERCGDGGWSAGAKALRAVVELHKPIEENGKLWCSHESCYNHLEFLERDDCYCDYPCPTIQAIEKALG